MQVVSIVHAEPPEREPEPKEINRCHGCGADLGPTIIWNLPCTGCDEPVRFVEKVTVMTFDDAIAAMYAAEDRYSDMIDFGVGRPR